MRQQEATFGIEHELNNVMAVERRYVHKQLDRAVEDTGSLDADGNEIYIIANPGEGLTAEAFPGSVAMPKPKRAVRQRRVRVRQAAGGSLVRCDSATC